MGRRLQLRPISILATAAVSVLSAHCGLLLGLEDFKDGASAGAGGGAGSGGGQPGATVSAGSGGTGGGTGGACSPGKARACYDGPPKSEGIGSCKAGVETCKADGTGYGPCAAEVVPAKADDCVKKVDATCDGMLECACTPNAEAACYDGPAATEGVGVCRGGKRTCNAEGTAFGKCDGEVTPVPDDCQGQADVACNGHVCAGGVWGEIYTCTQVLAIGNATPVNGLAVDGQGNSFLAGYFRGTVGFGSHSITSAGVTGVDDNFYLAKIDSSGSAVWAKAFGTSGTNGGFIEVTADQTGNVYLTGGLDQPVDFGGGALTGQAFVAAFDANGSPLWSKAFTATGNQARVVPFALAIDEAHGHVVLGGGLTGATSFDSGATTLTSKGKQNVFVASFESSNGSPLSSFAHGDVQGQPTGQSAVWSIACNAGGDIFLSGTFDQSLSLDGNVNLISAGQADIFLARFTGQGALIWGASYGTPLAENSSPIALDSTGAVVMTGNVTGPIDFGGGPLTGTGSDPFLVKFSATGVHQWSHRYPGTQGTYAGNVAIDSADSILLAGTATGPLDFGAGPVGPTGGSFLAKLDANAAYVWAKFFPNNIAEPQVAIDSSTNDVLSVFSAIVPVDFGTGPLTPPQVPPNQTSIVLGKLQP